jgi:hypothetical protein
VIAGVVAAILVAVAAVFGVGVSSANPKLADVGAWRWTKARGKIVHVNGLSGEVDGYLNKKSATQLHVLQDGSNVLLIDDGSGYVSRIEPSRLSVAHTRDFGTAGLQLVVSGAAGYAVDPAGKVQQIDPTADVDLAYPKQQYQNAATSGTGSSRQRATATSTTRWWPHQTGAASRRLRSTNAPTEIGDLSCTTSRRSNRSSLRHSSPSASRCWPRTSSASSAASTKPSSWP